MIRHRRNQSRIVRAAATIAAIAAAFAISAPAFAKPPATPAPVQATRESAEPLKRASAEPALSAAEITKRLDQLKSAAADLADRDKLIEVYEAALADLKQADQLKARAVEFDAERPGAGETARAACQGRAGRMGNDALRRRKAT
jgi:hypothetical protein